MADQSQQAAAQPQNQQPSANPQQPAQQQPQQGNSQPQASTQQQQTVAPIQQQPSQQPATPQQVHPQPATPQQVQQQQVNQPPTVQQHQQHQHQQPASVANAAISITPQNAAAIFSGSASMMTVSNPMVANSMMTVSNPMVANAMTANALAGNAMAGATLQGGIPSQAMTVNAANLRSATIPQVQVIPQMQSTPYMQYPFNQQQIMLQNAAMQGMSLQAAMQANAMNMNINPQINMANMNMAAMAMQQQRMGAGLMSPGPTTPTQNPGITFTPLQAQVSAAATSTANNGKALTVSKGQTTPSTPTQQAQATTLIGGKPIMPTQTNIAAQPLVLSVLPNQLTSTTGFVGSKGQSIALNQGAPAQLISTQAPIRFSQPQLVSSSGQINIQSQPIMTNQSILQAMATQLQQGAIPLGHQQLQLSASGQSPTILPGQPVYLRTTQIQGQQGVLAAQGVQIVGTSVKNSSQNNVAGVQIGKQTNQGQSVYPIKAVTARVNPTTVSKPKTAAVPGAPKNPKGRPRTANRIVGAMTASAGTNTVASALSLSKAASQSKPSTPTPNSLTVPNQSQSKSDSEMESTKKSAAGEKPEKTGSGKAIKQEKASGNVSVKSSAPEKMDTSELKTEGVKKENPSVVEKQKAIVKPHILTHVIEGFVIQEGPEPFPVQRSSLLTEFIPPKASQSLDRMEEESESAGPSEVVPKKEVPEPEFFSKCEFCGTEEQASRFKRSKRFCTMACAKRYNRAHRTSVFKTRGKHVGIGRGMIMKKGSPLILKKGLKGPGRGGKLPYGENREFPEGERDDTEPMEEGEAHSTSNTSTSNESSSAPDSPVTPEEQPDNSMESDTPTTNPGKWTVTEVYEFIKSMPGCTPYADEFKSQEIDGQALMLLKEDHLMTTMNMKLGPALKICAKINSFKGDLS
ncbi:polyhomeotic-like protein 2 isoform X1 [Saccostrea echinata]|uniref:polyhomeotic-like protein 2 isoform X1 n=1 Tax=Saccostrea echinata TaxID=191078 RepID=UPI002A823609|nr:polyhomeotic-like protein 2 isoform X1 [Saccostrea echinata]